MTNYGTILTAQSGSLWIEGSSLCYIDSYLEKICIDNSGSITGSSSISSSYAATASAANNFFIGNNLTTVNTGSFGMVGIGTTTPNFKLDVSGSANVTGSLSVGGANQGYQFDVKKTSTGDSTFDVIANFYKTSTHNTQLLVRAKESLIDFAGSYVTGGGGSFTQLSFSTTNASSINEVMRLDMNGNVGIGTTGPGAKLQVLGQAMIGAAPSVAQNDLTFN